MVIVNSTFDVFLSRVACAACRSAAGVASTVTFSPFDPPQPTATSATIATATSARTLVPIGSLPQLLDKRYRAPSAVTADERDHFTSERFDRGRSGEVPQLDHEALDAER